MNSYSYDLKNEIKDHLTVEVGDTKQPVFYPQVKLMRWNNEVNFSARLVSDEQGEDTHYTEV